MLVSFSGKQFLKTTVWDLPGGPVVKNPPDNARDTGLIPGPGGFHCHGAAKPVHHTTEPLRPRAHAPRLEKACSQQQGPRAATNK